MGPDDLERPDKAELKALNVGVFLDLTGCWVFNGNEHRSCTCLKRELLCLNLENLAMVGCPETISANLTGYAMVVTRSYGLLNPRVSSPDETSNRISSLGGKKDAPKEPLHVLVNDKLPDTVRKPNAKTKPENKITLSLS